MHTIFEIFDNYYSSIFLKIDQEKFSNYTFKNLKLHNTMRTTALTRFFGFSGKIANSYIMA